MFTREEFLAAPLRIEEVKQNGVVICCVRELSTTERSAFDVRWLEIIADESTDNDDLFYVFITISCACDSGGDLLFTESDIDAIKAGGHPRTLLIKNEADKLNYFTQDMLDDLKKT